jgi:hypothetical protein
MFNQARLFFLVGLAIAAGSAGQPLQVGNLPAAPNIPLPANATDLFAGATASGVLTSASFAFSRFPCPAAVKIQFLRGVSPNVPHLFAERGPFDVTQAIQTVSLSPPVAVKAGDSLGIVTLTSCGTALGQAGEGLIWTGAADTLITDPFVIRGVTLSLAATGTRTAFDGVSGVLPVVFTGDGAANSHFRTEAQIHNFADVPISGELLFPNVGPRQVNGYARDYSLAPHEVQSVTLPGFGSVDVVPTTGSGPAVLVRVFNDLGTEGTVGFTELDLPPADALATGARGVVQAPADPVNFRLNIGFRSIVPATISITARRSDGTVSASTSVSVGRFLQLSAEQILGMPLEPGMTFTVEVTSGSAFVYGVIADNRTNDTSFQLARPIGSS